MNNKIFGFGPLALTTTLTTNILNPPTVTGGVNAGSSPCYIILSRISIVSKSTGTVTCTFYKGASAANAAGTEFIANGYPIPPNGRQDFFGLWRFESTDFLVGGANVATALTIEGAGEIGVAG